MTAGSVLPAVRARLIEILEGSLVGVAVGYHPPSNHVDLTTGPMGGPMEAIWLAGAAETDTVEPASLGVPVRIAERWTQTVVIQILGRDTNARQQDLDVRCGELLGEVVDGIAYDPHLDLFVDGWGKPTVTARAWRWQSGLLTRSSGTETANSRAELDLQVLADRC